MKYQSQIHTNNLRVIRKSLQLRQVDVAGILGFCTTDRISHWENGLTLPSLINLFRLCSIYKTSPQEMYADLHAEIWSEILKKLPEKLKTID
jgi:transcriptional regulator with XRE-family HTH domain